MIARTELEGKLQSVFEVISVRKNIITQLQNILYTSHNMGNGKVNAYVMGMDSLSNAETRELLWLTAGVHQVLEETDYKKLLTDIKIGDYFTNSELKQFSKGKLNNENNDIFPIRFSVIEIDEDQFVGKIDVNTLYRLYNNQIINYNRNTQRNLTKTSVHGLDGYKITVNEKSVREIADLMLKGLYIGNDLTFNLNLDDENCIWEDDGNGHIELISGQLDILDGFHRFRGAMLAKSKDSDFNYNFVLKLMNFDENKASTYIAQEDKRNKIDKKYSKAMDNTNPTNLVIKRLNEDVSCLLYGQIGKNGNGKVDEVLLFNLIDYCFKIKERSDAMKVAKFLKNIFNFLVDYDETTIDTLSFTELAIIIRTSAYMYDNNKANQHMLVVDMLNKKNILTNDKFRRQVITKSLFKEIDIAIEGDEQ